MAELTSLVFKSDTTELERASKAIERLVSDMSKVSNSQAQIAKVSAQTEAILARAAKDYAKARIENAKAADQEIKSVIVADKADQAREKSVRKTTTATQESTKAVEKNVSILQRQSDILEFQTQGWSKGQSSILATAKAAGVAAQEMESLQKVLETQRKLMGGDPFDKSISGLKSLQNQYTELKEAVRQYNTDSNLTAKQTKEIARDKERLIEKMKVEGASFQEIRSAVRSYNQEYVNLAGQYNKLSNAEADVIKQRKDMVSATNYVTIADQKMAAALQTSNASLDRGATDSLVKYENALRKSGMAQDVVTTKLATYRTQLAQVQAQEMKRAEQHLARMASPQLTDLAVSLYSGQAPLTVLLQQGGQLADGLRLSGVEAEKFGKILKESFYSMIPIIKQVGVGLGGLVTGMAADAGSALTGFIGKITGITAATEIMKRAIASGGEENFKYIASIQKLGNAFSVVAGVGIAALITGLVAVGLEYKKILQSEAELSVVLATSGGALGLSKDQAVQYAQSLQSIGVGTLKAQSAIVEFAKAGKVGQENFDAVIKSAVELEKTAGVAIEETAKQFAKLQDTPSKTLTEIAEKTGLVDAATLDLVRSLEQQGEKAEAANVATLAFASANIQAANEVRSNWSPLEVLWNDIRSVLGKVKQEIYDITTSNQSVGAFRTVWETVAVVVSQVWFTLKGVGTEIGGIAAQIGAVMRGDFAGAKSIGEQMTIDAQAAREEQDKLITSLLTRGQVEGKQFNESKKQQSDYAAWLNENDKALDKSISKKEQYAIKEKKLQKDLESGLIKEVQYNEALTGWKKIIFGEEKKKKDTKTESFFESSMKALRNNTVEAAVANDGLVESQVKLLQIIKDPAFAKMTEIQKIQIMQAGAAAIATEQQAEAVKQLEKAEEFRLKVLGKSEGVGKQYYSDMEALMKYAKTAGWTTEQVEELTRAIYMQTPAWKSYEKTVDAVTAAVTKHNGASSDMMSEADSLLANLELRERAIGKTKSEQDALYESYRKNNKITEVRIKLSETLRKIEKDITAAQKDGLIPDQYRELTEAKVNAAAAAGKAIEAINKETSVKAREEADKEFAEFKAGISGSIVTALFEGGKEGSKKLRQVLVDTLRKKVTIVVDAVVNTLLGNVVGSLFGGSGGGAGGSAGGSILGTISNGFSALNGSIANGFSNAFTSFASSSVGQSLGLSNSSAIMGNNPSAFVPPGGQLTSLGSGLGTAAGMLGSGLAGYGISSAISGGYTTGGNTVNAIAGITSAFLGPIAGVVGGLINRAFGRKLKDTGIQGTFGGQAGFEGEGYQFYKGGWLRSDKTKTSELDSGLQKMLSDSFKAMQVQAGTFATVLGLSTDKIAGFTTSMKVSLHGLKEEEIQGKIQEALATANNELAQQIIGTWTSTSEEITRQVQNTWAEIEGGADAYRVVTETVEKSTYVASEYAKEGEKAIDTLTRLAGSLITVNDTFKNLGWSLYEASLAGASASSKFVDLFGTMENFTQAASTYYENFYTEAERAANVTRDITEALAKFGLETPKTREGYRALVEQQQKLGESGAESVAVLLKLSGAFAEISQTTEEANQAISDSFARENEILRLTGQEVLAVSRERAKELAALDPANRALQERIYALQDEQSATEKANAAAQAAAKAHEELIRVLTEIVKTALQILDNAIKKEKEVAKSTFDALMKDIDNRRNVTVKAFEAQRNMLTVAIEGASNLANLLKEEANRIRGYATGMKLASDPTDILGGALSAQARLRSGDTSNAVLEAATNIDPEMFATWADYATNFFATQGIISDFADKADRQASEAVSQVSLLERQLELTELQHQSDLEHYTKLEEAAKLSLEAQIAYYDSILEIANMQLEEALGTKLAVMSLGDAMNNFSGAIEKLSAATRNKVTSILPSLSGLPSFDVGTNYVPNNMIAQIHKGEAIIPAAYNPAATGSLTSEEVVNVLIEIKNVLVNTQNVTIDQKQSSDKLVRLIDSVTEGGQGMINAE